MVVLRPSWCVGFCVFLLRHSAPNPQKTKTNHLQKGTASTKTWNWAYPEKNTCWTMKTLPFQAHTRQTHLGLRLWRRWPTFSFEEFRLGAAFADFVASRVPNGVRVVEIFFYVEGWIAAISRFKVRFSFWKRLSKIWCIFLQGVFFNFLGSRENKASKLNFKKMQNQKKNIPWAQPLLFVNSHPKSQQNQPQTMTLSCMFSSTW